MIRKKASAFILFLLLFILEIRCASGSEIREFIHFLGNEQPLRYEITAEFGKLPQFDDSRTENLNRLIRHLAFHGSLNPGKAALTVSLDGKDLFSVLKDETGENAQTVLSADRDHAYILPGNSVGTAGFFSSFQNVFQDISSQKDLYFSLEPYAAFTEYLMGVFPERCGSSKILEKYKDYGTAVNRVTLRIDADELLSVIRNYPKDFPAGSGIPDLRKCLFSGRQDFEFLVTDEGKIMKVRYGGNAGYTEEDLRAVRLEWKTVRNGSVERDELSLRTPNMDASGRNNLLLEHLWRITDEGKETFSWKAETDDLKDGIRIRRMIQCSAETDQDLLSGSFSETYTDKRLNTANEVLFSVGCGKADQYSGTLEIISKKDKIETGRLKIGFTLSEDPPSLEDTSFQEPVIVSEEDYYRIRQKLVSSILAELVKLPAEDLVFLTEGLPEEAISQILINHAAIKESKQ